jgi:dethiobiotin synthetase
MLEVFISGLGKQTGKTVVSTGLAITMQSLAYSTAFYKPIQTGANSVNGVKTSQDLALVKRFDSNITVQSTYVLKSSSSPFVGVYEEGMKIDINAIYNEYQALARTLDCKIVEGSNSISTPVAQYLTEADIVKSLKTPLVLVVNPAKTPIDTVISGLNYVKSSRINLWGIIINQYDENSQNLEHKYFPQIIKEYSDVKVLGFLPNYENISTITPDVLISDTLNNINIEEIFGLKIAKLNY